MERLQPYVSYHGEGPIELRVLWDDTAAHGYTRLHGYMVRRTTRRHSSTRGRPTGTSTLYGALATVCEGACNPVKWCLFSACAGSSIFFILCTIRPCKFYSPQGRRRPMIYELLRMPMRLHVCIRVAQRVGGWTHGCHLRATRLHAALRTAAGTVWTSRPTLTRSREQGARQPWGAHGVTGK